MKISTSTLILIVLFAGAVIWALCERNSKQAAKAQAKQSAVLKDPVAPLTKQFKDSLQQNHSAFDVSANKIDGKLVAVSKSVVDSVAQLSGIKPEQVTNWQEIAMTSKAELLQAKRTVDSLKTVVFTYENPYIRLSYTPKKEGDTAAGVFGYKYNAKITATTYTDGLRFLGAPLGFQRSLTDIYGNDPNMTINGLRTLQIEQKKQPLSLNVYAFSNYLFADKDLQAGIGAQIDVGRLSINGGYYYNTNDFNTLKKPKPFAGAKLSLFK